MESSSQKPWATKRFCPAASCSYSPASGTATAPAIRSAGTNTGYHSAVGTSTSWFNTASLTPSQPVLHTGVNDAILHPYLAALDRVRAEPIGYQQLIAVNVLEIIAAALAAVRRRRSNSRAENIVREAKTLIEQQAAETISMKRLAAGFQLGEKHFRRLFKEQTGLSPYQYYLQVRVHRAKEMLLGTTLSIKEIAASLHFETPFHFSTFFKKKTGMSPSRWRSGRD